jgi:hypothetical protein
MLETNIRVVYPGSQLYVSVRRTVVTGQTISDDLLERMCTLLRRKCNISAVRVPSSKNEIFVAISRPLEQITLEEENWQLTAIDSGDTPRRLTCSNAAEQALISSLVERALLVQIAEKTSLWTLDTPRILYETEPFQQSDGVSAFHRYEIDALGLGDAGIGISVDIGTAFFSQHSLDYYFDASLNGAEAKLRRAEFDNFTSRQDGQKGTLLYNNGRSNIKCYFENNNVGMTCGGTGSFKIAGETFASLYDYYSSKFGSLQVKQSDTAVHVSFPGLDRPVPVAAKLLSLRVMNDDVPESLSSVDKIHPSERKRLITEFWKKLEPRPMGNVAPGMVGGFWQPKQDRVDQISFSEIQYGPGHKIAPPSRSVVSIKNHFRSRLEMMEKGGCYHFPPSAPRTLYCAFPQPVGNEIPEKLANDMVGILNKWTGLSFSSNLIDFTTASEAFGRLRRMDRAGVVLFILDEEPAAYYDASFNLEGWRVKRVTEPVLRQQYKYLTVGVRDRKTGEFNLRRGQARWDSFVNLIGLDVLQQMDAVPYRVANIGAYESQLIIDVGHDRRFFAVSLLIARAEDKTPTFCISSLVQHKADSKHESINPIVLRDAIVNIFKSVMRRKFDALSSLLIMRDGNIQGGESGGIDEASVLLRQQAIISNDARIDLVGIHKESLSGIRLWDVDERDSVTNTMEGTGLLVNNNLYVVASTGEATLTQGTAQPIAIVNNGRCISVGDAGSSIFLAAQLNWSSPGVAQRLPLPLKRTDDELAARSDQEIRRIR